MTGSDTGLGAALADAAAAGPLIFGLLAAALAGLVSVSYTHLTLPTIYSV